jgi:hypothetical protein
MILYLAASLTGFVYRGVPTFLPARFRLGNGSGRLSAAGAVTSPALLVGMAGQCAGGTPSQRFPPALLFATLMGLSTPCRALVADRRIGVAAAALAAGPVMLGTLTRGSSPADDAPGAPRAWPG